MKKSAIGVIVLVIVALGAMLFIHPPAAPDEPLPVPNGYDDFMKATDLLVGDASGWPQMATTELRLLVTSNQPAMDLVRAGLTKECRVIPYEITASNNTHMDALANTKRMAHCFAAGSKLALLEGRTNDAARVALDGIRYGHEVSRGGVLIDGLVGLAIEALGRARLEEAFPGTDTATAREIAAVLEQISERREPASIVWKREADWARRGRFGTANFFTQFLQPILQRNMKAKAEQRFQQAAADLHRTTLRAAAHAYELDQGKPPVSARDLVPNYLKSVPLDPVTGREMPLN